MTRVYIVETKVREYSQGKERIVENYIYFAMLAESDMLDTNHGQVPVTNDISSNYPARFVLLPAESTAYS